MMFIHIFTSFEINILIVFMKFNFFAGPAILPAEVIKEAQEGIENFAGMGLSILEISHRSTQFVEVIEEARNRVKSLLNIGSSHEVLFLTGGASTQFFMAPMNLLPPSGKAAYINTGAWSKKAIHEARLFGEINIVASSEDKGFNYIPKQYEIDPSASYLHITTNNTIYGTQFHSIPDVRVPIVGDMSSDIFSREIDINKYDLIYAGAQKNLGPAGTTLVIVRKDALGKTGREIASILDYRSHIAKDSMFNTPPVYAIYVSLLSLRWIEKMGGVSAIAKINDRKAKLIYDELDRNELFIGYAQKADRSKMNVSFTINEASLEETFLTFAEEHGCIGIKGHRSVGGFRASIYNAMPIEGVERLVEVMQDFEKQYG